MAELDIVAVALNRFGLRAELKALKSGAFYDIFSALRGPDVDAESALSEQLKYIFTARIRYYVIAQDDTSAMTVRRQLISKHEFEFAYEQFKVNAPELLATYGHFMQHALEALIRLAAVYNRADEIVALLELSRDITYNELCAIEKYHAVYTGSAAPKLSCKECGHGDFWHIKNAKQCTARLWNGTSGVWNGALGDYIDCRCERFIPDAEKTEAEV